MLAGEALPADRDRLARALRQAEAMSGLSFSLYVGVTDADARAAAERRHAASPDPDHTVLVLCDPEFHALEIVTGQEAARQLDDRACALAAATMQTSFVGGDLTGGLVHGIAQLGEAARVPPTLHTA